MLYFIGGPARCGKTTLAREVRKHIDAQVVPTDGMTAALQKNIGREILTDLSAKSEMMDVDISANEKLERARRRDLLVWKFLQSFVEEAEFSDDNLLMEGGLWADALQDLLYAHRAVFLVDTSDDHVDRVLEIKNKATHSNWMKEFSDEQITAWAEFNLARSFEHIRLCKEYGYPYFDIKDHGIERAQQLALQSLVGES